MGEPLRATYLWSGRRTASCYLYSGGRTASCYVPLERWADRYVIDDNDLFPTTPLVWFGSCPCRAQLCPSRAQLCNQPIMHPKKKAPRFMFFLLPGIFKGNVRALALFFGAQGRQCLYLAPRPLRFAQASHLPRPYRSEVGVAKQAPPRRDHPTRLYKQRRDGAGSASHLPLLPPSLQPFLQPFLPLLPPS